jgi:diguanylate cyclase (GGDEF)-like protein
MAVEDALGRGLSPVRIQSRVIAPAMRSIGELWERGVMTVTQEHLATAVSQQVLARLYTGLLGPTAPNGDPVVVAAVHGEHHVLGLRMAADVFDGAGYDVRFLGADVPLSSLLAWVAEHQPAAVALGVTMPLGAATLAREVWALRDLDPGLCVIIGGQGVPAMLREGAGVFYAPDTVQLAAYANRGLHPPPTGELPAGIACGGVRFGQYSACFDASSGFAASFAQTTAAAADLARGYARRAVALERIALRDPLTELWNRRAFDDRRQALTAGGITAPPSLLMIDIDTFKAVNDRLGHGAGDRALIGVARCLTSVIRDSDFAARYGGDEFAVLLPETPLQVASEIGERIRSRIERELTDPQITVSIGICAPDHNDLRRCALDVDSALYKAKERGRNQVAVA